MRLRAIISYDGSQFSGYQVQPGKRTVQLEIERVLETIHKGAVLKLLQVEEQMLAFMQQDKLFTLIAR